MNLGHYQKLQLALLTLLIPAMAYGVYRAEIDSIARHEIQKEQIAAQEKRDILFEAIGETLLPRLVAVLHTPDELEIISANTPACKLFEMEREEIIGHNAFEFVPEELREKHLKGVEAYLKGEKELVTQESTLVTAKGNPIRVRYRVAELKDRGNGHRWFAIRFRELTEDK